MTSKFAVFGNTLVASDQAPFGRYIAGRLGQNVDRAKDDRLGQCAAEV